MMSRLDSYTSSSTESGPLFVIGMWRSGTSLLYTLLNQHPQIALLYEGDLPLLRPLFSRKGSKKDWLARWEFWNSALSRHRIPADRIPAIVPDLPTGAMAVWKEYAGTAAIFGEKSPDYCDSLQTLAHEFPGARFIILWRNPADICRSIIRARKGSSFFSKPGMAHRAILGSHKLKQECDALLSQRIPVHQIQYEKMVQDSAKVMAGVCQFLGIPFDPTMCSLEGSDRSAIHEGAHHELVKQEEILSSTKREEVLPPRLKRKIERYVSYWKNKYGDVWPQYPEWQAVSGYPTAAQRFLDDALFRALRILDGFTAFVYCYAPLSWLDRYRSFRRRRYQIDANHPPSAQPSSNPEALRRLEVPGMK
ncbi:MAG: sulfotransferase [Candidatus Sulfotelmatobacter sp.]